jgi:hypothetical protein
MNTLFARYVLLFGFVFCLYHSSHCATHCPPPFPLHVYGHTHTVLVRHHLFMISD